MSTEFKIKEMDEKIKLLRKTAEELMALGGDIQAVKKNLVRLLASTKMLELNVSVLAPGNELESGSTPVQNLSLQQRNAK